jgi:hypothetical protein
MARANNEGSVHKSKSDGRWEPGGILPGVTRPQNSLPLAAPTLAGRGRACDSRKRR